MFRVSCKDAGANCLFSIQSEDKGEVLSLTLQHARAWHKYDITPKLVEDLTKTIRTV